MSMVVDLTELLKEKKDFCPCNGCEVGRGSTSQWADLETGHLMQQSEDCMETCEIYQKQWFKTGII